MLRKRGQVWSLDLMVAVIIFSVALASFYFYTVNEHSGFEEKIEILSYEGRSLSNILLSDGYPEDWNSTNVVEMGILTNGKINQTKLEAFYNFVQLDYPQTKIVLNTAYDYYFFLDQNMTINSVEVEGIGKPGVTKDTIVAKNLIKISRVTIYQNKPIGAQLYIWEQ